VLDILLQSPGSTRAQLLADAARPPDYDFRPFFLTRPRVDLYRRVDARVEDMVARGLVGEAAAVLRAAGLPANSNCATRAIGYRQALELLERCAAGEAPSEQGVVSGGSRGWGQGGEAEGSCLDGTLLLC
jgi:tRNA dimethylallyltransferase